MAVSTGPNGRMCDQLTDGGDGGDDLTELEFVENGGLTSGIKTDLGRRSDC